MTWSTQEKTFCVEAYFANKSYTKVQANFRRHFRCHQVPSKSRIFDWTQKFREHWTVQNFNSKGLGTLTLVGGRVLGQKGTLMLYGTQWGEVQRNPFDDAVKI